MATKVTPRLKRPPPTFYFRAWRKYRGLTQEQLAELVGLATSSVSQIETGAQGFTNSTLIAFADALKCDPGDLLSRDPKIEDAIYELNKILRLASATDRARALRVVREMFNTGPAVDAIETVQPAAPAASLKELMTLAGGMAEAEIAATLADLREKRGASSPQRSRPESLSATSTKAKSSQRRRS